MEQELLEDIQKERHIYGKHRQPSSIADLKPDKSKHTRFRIHTMNESSERFRKTVKCNNFFRVKYNLNQNTLVGSVRAAWIDNIQGVRREPVLWWPPSTLFPILIDIINASTAGEKEPKTGKRRICHLDLYLRDTGACQDTRDWKTTVMG